MRNEFKTQVKREAWERCEKRCEGLLPSGERCDANLMHKPYHFDHVIPDAIGGKNDLANCAVLCVSCHNEKTRKKDMRIIAKAKRGADKHNGFKKRSSFRGWRKFDGTPVRAER